MREHRIGKLVLGVIAAAFVCPFLSAQEVARPTLQIPRLDEAPALADFLDMEPSAKFAGKMAQVEGFIQKEPSDGQRGHHSESAHIHKTVGRAVGRGKIGESRSLLVFHKCRAFSAAGRYLGQSRPTGREIL